MKTSDVCKLAPILALGWPGADAYAQAVAGPALQELGTAAGDPASPEIVVTAQRRSERLQDVPIAITAYSGDQVRERGITSSVDLAQVTPGVVMQQLNGRVDPYIGGLGSAIVLIGEVGSVATYLDGVYMPEVYGGTYSLANIESIEVLKGPQGTLFGRNTAGGAIVIRTRDPQFTPEGRIEVGYGNLDAVATSGYITGPISDQVALSATGSYNRSASYYRDLLRGGRLDRSEQYSLRGKVLIQPADGLEVRLIGDYAEIDNPTTVAGQPVNGYFGQTPSSLVTTGPRQYIGDVDPLQQHAIQSGVSGTISLELSDMMLTSTTAYRYSRVVLNIDEDHTPAPLFRLYYRQPTEAISQEVLLASSSETPLTWVVGGYYAHQDARYDPLTIFPGAANVEVKASLDIYALFGEVTWHVGDFELTGGLRYAVSGAI